MRLDLQRSVSGAPDGQALSMRTGAAAGAEDNARMRTLETNDLRKAGLKVTLPRIKILEILGTTQPRHMSAEDIYKHLLESHEDIGLATVYRVLTQFEAAGLVTRHHFEGTTAVFELNEGQHHDHIVCLDCGRVEEFMDAGIEERQRAVASKMQFEIKDHAMILYGRCRRTACPHRQDRVRSRQRELAVSHQTYPVKGGSRLSCHPRLRAPCDRICAA